MSDNSTNSGNNLIDYKQYEVLMTRINELSKQLSTYNKAFDNLIIKLDTMQKNIRSNESRIEDLESNPNNNGVQVVPSKLRESSGREKSEMSQRLDGMDKEISRLKNIMSSFILQNPDTSDSHDSEDDNESDSNDDSWDSRVNIANVNKSEKNSDE